MQHQLTLAQPGDTARIYSGDRSFTVYVESVETTRFGKTAHVVLDRNGRRDSFPLGWLYPVKP